MKNKTIYLVFLLITFFSINAQDWSNFKQFQKENAILVPLESGKDRIVFMGNSITIGWLNIHPLFFKNKPYVNRGIGGQTTPQMLVRFRADVVDIDATAVVILAGTNDIAENTGPTTLNMILDNLKSMSEIAQANNVKIILCSILPAYDYPWRTGLEPNVKIPELNKMIKGYAEANDIHYLDYFKALNDGKNGIIKKYTTDGVHLTEEGYKLLEPMLEKALKIVLK